MSGPSTAAASTIRRNLTKSSTSSSGRRFISNFGSGGGTGAPASAINYGIGVDRSYLGRRRADKVSINHIIAIMMYKKSLAGS